jgi:hypothetical protein
MSTSSTLQQDHPSCAANELIVTIRPHNLDLMEYQGTRAQLEAEGVIPEGTVWPDGDRSSKWQAGPFDYDLRRKRPDGMKGPKKLWVEGDWWVLRWEPTYLPPYAEREIKIKTKELADAIYRRSPKGEAEFNARWNRYWEAKQDQKFQAFIALIPGLVRPKRGRRPRNAECVGDLKAND